MINAAWSYLRCISITLFLALQLLPSCDVSFWMQEEFFKVWNVSDKIDKDYKLLHLTNNGLERYSKHFNIICLDSHPNLVAFVHALYKEADRVVQWMDAVSKGREIPPHYNEHFPPKSCRFLFWWQKTKSKVQSCRQEQESKEGCLVNVLVWFGLGSLGRLYVIV